MKLCEFTIHIYEIQISQNISISHTTYINILKSLVHHDYYKFHTVIIFIMDVRKFIFINSIIVQSLIIYV